MDKQIYFGLVFWWRRLNLIRGIKASQLLNVKFTGQGQCHKSTPHWLASNHFKPVWCSMRNKTLPQQRFQSMWMRLMTENQSKKASGTLALNPNVLSDYVFLHFRSSKSLYAGSSTTLPLRNIPRGDSLCYQLQSWHKTGKAPHHSTVFYGLGTAWPANRGSGNRSVRTGIENISFICSNQHSSSD